MRVLRYKQVIKSCKKYKKVGGHGDDDDGGCYVGIVLEIGKLFNNKQILTAQLRENELVKTVRVNSE